MPEFCPCARIRRSDALGSNRYPIEPMPARQAHVSAFRAPDADHGNHGNFLASGFRLSRCAR